jgi:hypothetical protein
MVFMFGISIRAPGFFVSMFVPYPVTLDRIYLHKQRNAVVSNIRFSKDNSMFSYAIPADVFGIPKHARRFFLCQYPVSSGSRFGRNILFRNNITTAKIAVIGGFL